jgi:hypothetical protein
MLKLMPAEKEHAAYVFEHHLRNKTIGNIETSAYRTIFLSTNIGTPPAVQEHS